MQSNKKILAIDVDGTLVEHQYPKLGREVPHAVRVCKRLVAEGHQLLLFTMRSGKELQEAYDWCVEQGIQITGVNCNPTQLTWTNSVKVYANYYVDDAAIGCPLIQRDFQRPYVDWIKIEEMLLSIGILTPEERIAVAMLVLCEVCRKPLPDGECPDCGH